LPCLREFHAAIFLIASDRSGIRCGSGDTSLLWCDHSLADAHCCQHVGKAGAVAGGQAKVGVDAILGTPSSISARRWAVRSCLLAEQRAYLSFVTILISTAC
jgi:hypothetical protein